VQAHSAKELKNPGSAGVFYIQAKASSDLIVYRKKTASFLSGLQF